MFKRKIKYGILIKAKISPSIHTLFMFETIDIYFLDINKKIIEIKRLKPWKFYFPNKNVEYILEFKKNTVNKKELEINDKLYFYQKSFK